MLTLIMKRVITVKDNGVDHVGDYLDWLLEQSKDDNDAKYHLAFIQFAIKRLSISDLDVLCREYTQLDIMVGDESFSKRYILAKPLAKAPIYELRYGISSNAHLRLLFFPYKYNGIEYIVFCYVFLKTRKPPKDETNLYRDKAYNMYQRVKREPEKYLEGF